MIASQLAKSFFGLACPHMSRQLIQRKNNVPITLWPMPGLRCCPLPVVPVWEVSYSEVVPWVVPYCCFLEGSDWPYWDVSYYVYRDRDEQLTNDWTQLGERLTSDDAAPPVVAPP